LALISSMASLVASMASRPTWSWIAVLTPMTIGLSSARAAAAGERQRQIRCRLHEDLPERSFICSIKE
jgi:hypothetical protein